MDVVTRVEVRYILLNGPGWVEGIKDSTQGSTRLGFYSTEHIFVGCPGVVLEKERCVS